MNSLVPIKIGCNGNAKVFGIFYSVENLGMHSIIESFGSFLRVTVRTSHLGPYSG